MPTPSDLARRAHALFAQAMNEDGPARLALVHARCAGDPELLQRVTQLLAATSSSIEFLDTPVLGEQPLGPGSIPDAVGSYLVVGVLGSGGMATVYEAVQEQPNRRVALKVLHQSLLGSDANARFRFETETLARLQHPGIAQIFEAGTAHLGQPAPVPFFAMELVLQARSITDFALHHNVSWRGRIAMLAAVCDAVHHGHQHGIIHRDLKPANVLVDPEGRAKVIDFGIARATEPAVTSMTTALDGPRLMGTLNYMSPEQCSDPAAIDVRTDVYSLGVMLYELVTGRLPHDLSNRTIPAAIRTILESTPSLASTFVPAAKGDLDAVIAMALEKDRKRRYAGAADLAADLRRFLAGLPVHARPPTTLEHIWKFANRNRPLALALSAAVLLLIAGVVVSGTFAYRAARARDAALQRERDLEVVTAFQESLLQDIDLALMGDKLKHTIESSIERSTLLESPEVADEALRDWESLAQRVNFTSVAITSFKDSVLDRYAASIRSQFANQPLLRARLLYQLATTTHRLGLHSDAEPLLRDVIGIRESILGTENEETLHARHALGSLLLALGRFEESLSILRSAYDLAGRTLGRDDLTTLRIGTSLGGVYRRMGHLDDAQVVWQDTLERLRRVSGDDDPSTLRALNNMGVLYAVRGQVDKAEACWREFLERRRRTLGEDHADYLGSLGNLAVLFQDQGRFSEAKTLFEQELASNRRQHGDANADTLRSMARLASLLQEMGDLPAAEILQRQCVAGRLTVFGPEHIDTLGASSFLASILIARKNYAEAEPLLRETLAIQQRHSIEPTSDILETNLALAELLLATQRTDESLALSDQAVALSASVPPANSDSLGRTMSAHALSLATAGHADRARAAHVQAHALLERSQGESHPQTRLAAKRLAEFIASETARAAP